MLSCKQLDDFKLRVDIALDDLKDKIVTDYLKDIRQEVEYLRDHDALHYANEAYLRNTRILSRLYVYLINGISFSTALNQLEVDFNIPLYQFQDWICAVHTRFKNDLRPHKIYAAHKMHAAGISNIKIAELLKVHPQTVARFLRMKTNFKD